MIVCGPSHVREGLVDVKYKSGYMRMVIVDHRAKTMYR